MPASPARRRTSVAVASAITITLCVTGCSAVDGIRNAGEELQRRIGEALGGGAVSDEGDTGIYVFAVGDCMNDAGVDPDADAVASLDAADCDRPHDSEVIGLVQIDGLAYPGDEEVIAQSETLCLEAFEKWTGGDYADQPDLEFSYYTPTASGWLTGDSTTMCTAYAVGQLTGTTRGAATSRATLTIGAPIVFPGWVVSDEGNTPIGEIGAGDCLDDANVADNAMFDEVRSLDVVDCASPHDAEALGVVSISGEAYLGDDETVYGDAVGGACVPLFEARTGAAYDDAPDLDYGFYLVPTIKSRMPSYDGVCTIYRVDGSQVTESPITETGRDAA